MSGGFSGVRGGSFGGFRSNNFRANTFRRSFFGVGFLAPNLYYPNGLYSNGFYPYDFGYSSYWPSYGDNLAYYPDGYPYATLQTSPNVTVYYPAQTVTVAPERARPVIREYDQNGLEIRPAGSPQYLIAFTDHTIRLATSYRVDGETLRYLTPEKEDKEAPMSTVDRVLSEQLNRERRVPFQLPPQ